MATPTASSEPDIAERVDEDGDRAEVPEIERLREQVRAAEEGLRALGDDWASMDGILGRVDERWASDRAAREAAEEARSRAEERTQEAESERDRAAAQAAELAAGEVALKEQIAQLQGQMEKHRGEQLEELNELRARHAASMEDARRQHEDELSSRVARFQETVRQAEERAIEAEARNSELAAKIETLQQRSLTDQLLHAQEEEHRLAEQLLAARERRSEFEQRVRSPGYIVRDTHAEQEDPEDVVPASDVEVSSPDTDAMTSWGPESESSPDAEPVLESKDDPGVGAEPPGLEAASNSPENSGAQDAKEPSDEAASAPASAYEDNWYRSLRAAVGGTGGGRR